MQPLLRIETNPIQISYSTKRAQLNFNYKQPRAEVNRVRGKAEIRNDYAKVKMDSYEMRASMGLKTAPRVIQEAAQTGRSDALEAISSYGERRNQVLDSRGQGTPIAEYAMSKVLTPYETMMAFIPSVRPEMWMEGGTVSFDYSPDRLEYNWDLAAPSGEFIPGGVEFTVSQYPEVIIEYLGSPIYAPPSADPNYEAPPSVDAVG